MTLGMKMKIHRVTPKIVEGLKNSVDRSIDKSVDRSTIESAKSMNNLAWCYEHGLCLMKNNLLAFELYKKSSESSYIYGHVNLCKMLSEWNWN